MSWRNHKTHREETKAVKASLTAAGIPVKQVGHGTGTAWGWLEINVGPNPGGLSHDDSHHNAFNRHPCPACLFNRVIEEKVIRIAQEVTGRRGDYQGNILVLSQ